MDSVLEQIKGLGANEAAIAHAEIFLNHLPSSLSDPTSANVESDGCIEIEWYQQPFWIVSVSVAKNGLIYYAALLNEDNPRGMIKSVNEMDPLIELIREWAKTL